MDGEVIWALPVNESKEYISSNVKNHCFEDGKSLCGKYVHDSEMYDTTVPSGDILSNPHFACNICYKKWKKMFDL